MIIGFQRRIHICEFEQDTFMSNNFVLCPVRNVDEDVIAYEVGYVFLEVDH